MSALPESIRPGPAGWVYAALFAALFLFLFLPPPPGLSVQGYRTLLVCATAVVLWTREILPPGLTGGLVILLLILTGASSSVNEALVGFSQPVIYFLIGVFTIAIAVERVGLAERIGRYFLRYSGGKSRSLFWFMVLSFPPMALIMPSSNSRSIILAEVFDRTFSLAGVEKGAPLARAIMMALHSLNRLASSALLTGGMTSIVAANLIGGLGWTRWFLLLGVPYCLTLCIGSLGLHLKYLRGGDRRLTLPPQEKKPLNGGEIRTSLIILMASLLWLSDAVHGLHPAVPAMMAWTLLLLPGIGVLKWGDFESRFSWATFFLLGASLSLGWTLAHTGAAKWLALSLLHLAPALAGHPYFLFAAILIVSVPIRILVPNITGYLAITIPISIEIGQGGGLNPLACALGVLLMGDSILFYPAQSPGSLAVYERGHLTAGEIFRFGLFMTGVSFVTTLTTTLLWWRIAGLDWLQ
ncbi:MAG: SLC13 family permease [Nitrospinota bacterium]